MQLHVFVQWYARCRHEFLLSGRFVQVFLILITTRFAVTDKTTGNTAQVRETLVQEAHTRRRAGAASQEQHAPDGGCVGARAAPSARHQDVTEEETQATTRRLRHPEHLQHHQAHRGVLRARRERVRQRQQPPVEGGLRVQGVWAEQERVAGAKPARHRAQAAPHETQQSASRAGVASQGVEGGELDAAHRRWRIH